MKKSDSNNISSHRHILRSATTFGSASAVKVVIGLIKVKFVAVLLGPAGIGLLGLYESLMAMVATFVGMGLSNSGVRQLASSDGNSKDIAITRNVLWYSSITLGVIGMILMWLFRESLALLVFSDIAYAQNIGYLGIAVLLTIISGTQMAVLQGLRKISDMARVTIVSSLAGLLVSLVIIWFMRNEGIIWYIVAGPGITIIVASYLMRNLSLASPGISATMQGTGHLKTMLVLGVTFMATQFITEATRVGVRSYIVLELGIDASGQFQAVWAVSMTYLGFIITAMTADYYPRLTNVIHDRQKSNRIVAEQTEVALLLAGPLILLVQALAPWVIRILYSSDFLASVDILRWLILGDVLKLLAWPLGYILIAKGKWKLFFITQLTWNLTYFLFVWAGLPELGLVVTGMAYGLSYLIVLLLNTVLVTQINGYRWTTGNIMLGVAIGVLCALIYGISIWSTEVSAIIGVLLAMIIGVLCLKRIVYLAGLKGDIIHIGARGKAAFEYFSSRKRQD